MNRFLFAILLSLCCTNARASSDFFDVVNAANEIVAGRTFENEDGIRLSFGPLKQLSVSKSELTLKVTFSDGSKKIFREAIIHDEHQVRLEQSDGRSRPVQFFISVDEPFHVLRIRPMEPTNTEFLSRECLYQKEDKRHFCYMKSKVGSEVFVSVFVEIEACE